MRCRICKKQIDSRRVLKRHINRYHGQGVSSSDIEVEYIRSALGITKKKIDSIVKEYLKGLTIQELLKKYNFDFSAYLSNLGIKRTNSESKRTKKYKKKYSKTIKERYGVKNISQHQSVKDKKKKTFLKNFGYENNFCNPVIQKEAISKIDRAKAYKKLKEAIFKKYGVDNITKVKRVAKKISKIRKEECKKLSYEEKLRRTRAARENVKYESSQELRIEKILKNKKIEFLRNQFILDFNFDFVFPNKVLLEVQGEFWHANPKKYKPEDKIIGKTKAKDIWDKDERKKKAATESGYKIFYLWEFEINKMTDTEILKYITRILKNEKTGKRS